MEYLGTIYKGSQSDIIFPVPFIELSDGATVDFYTDGDGGFSRTKDEIKIDNYMLRTTASADELNSLNDGVLNYTINTCMGKSEGDTGLYLSEPTSYVDKQYLTADGVKTINGESIVGQGNIEIQGGGSEDYVWEWIYTPYYTGNTNFSEEELQSVIDAHNNGKNIIIKYNTLFIYPSTFEVAKTVLLIEYMYNGDTYIFEYNSDGQSQTISKKDESEIYEWAWWRSDMMSLTGGTTNFTIDVINKIKEVISNGKLIVINYVNQYRWPVYTAYIGNHKITLDFGQDKLLNYQWECQLSSDEQSITYQRVTRTLQQEKLTSRSVITINNINLANNNDVDSILTNLKSSAETTNSNINTLSGSVVNNYYTKSQCDANYETKGYSYSKSESDTNYALKSDTYTKTEVDDKIKNISGGTSDDSNFKKLRIDISGKTLEQDFMPLFNYLDGLPNSPDMLGCINLILDGKLYIPTKIETEVSPKGYYILIYATGTIDAKRVQLSKYPDSEYTSVYIRSYHLYSDNDNGLNIYIPTKSGNAGQILKSNGLKQIPTWVDFSEYSYTKEEIDSKIGDINNILESI